MSWKQKLEATGINKEEADKRTEAARAEEAFRRLVRQLVDSEDSPPAAVIRQVLSAAGKTSNDLENLCRKYEHRKEARTQFDKAEELWNRQCELKRGACDARQKFNAAQYEWETFAAHNELETRTLSHNRMSILEGRAHLLKDCSSDAAERITAVILNIESLHSRIEICENLITECELALAMFRLKEEGLKQRGGKHYSDPLHDATEKERISKENTKEVGRLRAELALAVAEKARQLTEALAP